MMNEAEVRQMVADLEQVQGRTLALDERMCVNAAHGALKAVLGEANGCGPAEILLELRATVKASRAKEN